VCPALHQRAACALRLGSTKAHCNPNADTIFDVFTTNPPLWSGLMGSCHCRTRILAPPALRRQSSAALRDSGMSRHLGPVADRPFDPPCCAMPAVSWIGAALAELNCADSFRVMTDPLGCMHRLGRGGWSDGIGIALIPLRGYCFTWNVGLGCAGKMLASKRRGRGLLIHPRERFRR
jgi:hypothetical protein